MEWTSGYKETNAYGEAVFREAEKKLKSKVRIIYIHTYILILHTYLHTYIRTYIIHIFI